MRIIKRIKKVTIQPQNETLKTAKQLAQGDVLLHPNNEIDTRKLQSIATKKFTVALGEKTGHHHDLRGDIQVFKGNRMMVVCVGKEGAVLEHLKSDNTQADHQPIQIEFGTYEIRQQREFSLLDGIRAVQD